MAYGPPPPAPGPGRQPVYGQQSPWQQPPGQYAPPPQGPPPGRYGLPPSSAVGGGGYRAPVGPSSPEEQKWALMAYIGQFLGSAVAPAVVLVSKGRSPFVRQHAAQGLNIGLGAIAVWAVGLFLAQFMDALAVIPLGYTALVLYFLVRAGIAVNRGEFLRVPAFVAWPLLK